MNSIYHAMVCCFTALLISMAATAGENKRPNILLIIADDLGFTDLGSFGGEIATPTLDQLAVNGLRLTNFHTAPTCSLTRSMLMSGSDNHLAGLGNMAELLAPNQKGQPGYEGFLNERVAPLSQLLQDAGYSTYIAGKWHLGKEENTSPAARGFDRSFVLTGGDDSHLGKNNSIGTDKAPLYREDGKVAEIPADFYSTRFYTDKLLEYLQQGRLNQDKRDAPFFAMLSYTAPHWPLQAPQASIARYRGKYDAGYQQIYQQRLDRLSALQLLPIDPKTLATPAGAPAWDSLSDTERQRQARIMEVYAAMVDDMDREIGRVIDYLKHTGDFADTLIIFLSDNGAEGHDLSKTFPWLQGWLDNCCNNSAANIGNGDSFIWYGPNWGRVSNGPFRGMKGYTDEGGIRVPAFIHYPDLTRQAAVSHDFISVMDILPTLLEIAGTVHPGEYYRGHKIVPLRGRSMLPYLQGETQRVHSEDYAMGWEFSGKTALWQNGWKITLRPGPDNNWRLFNLRQDPFEQTDLADKQAEKLQQMLEGWRQYVRDNNVISPNIESIY